MTASATPATGATWLMHVAGFCPDVDESLRFYRDGLGLSRTYEWTRTASAAGQVVYSGRGVYVELRRDTYLELFPGGGDGTDSSAGPLQHIAPIVADVDAAYGSCLAAGATDFPLDDWSGGPTTVVLNGEPEVEVRVAFVKGPAGELIELYEQHGAVVTR